MATQEAKAAKATNRPLVIGDEVTSDGLLAGLKSTIFTITDQTRDKEHSRVEHSYPGMMGAPKVDVVLTADLKLHRTVEEIREEIKALGYDPKKVKVKKVEAAETDKPKEGSVEELAAALTRQSSREKAFKERRKNKGKKGKKEEKGEWAPSLG